MDGGLCRDDEVADDHADGDEQPAPPKGGERLTDLAADGHEADVRARQKEHEPHKGIEKTHEDTDDLLLVEGARDELEHEEKGKDRRKRDEHFEGVVCEPVEIQEKDVARVFGDGGRCDFVLDARNIEDDAEHEHGDDGPDARECDETEGVVLPALVASDGGNADAQRHDEGHGHRPRRHAARIKGDRPEIFRDKDAQNECRDIKDDEEHGEPDAEHDTQHRDREEDAHPHRDRDDEKIVAELRNLLRNGGDLLCEDLQIGLCDRHDDTDDEREERDEPDLARMRHR